MLSEAAKYIISRCYKDGKPMNVQLLLDNTYEVNGKKFKPTQDLLNEIETSEMVKVVMFEKMVNIFGIEGMEQ